MREASITAHDQQTVSVTAMCWRGCDRSRSNAIYLDTRH